MFSEKVTKKLLSSIGLFQNILGDRYSDLVAINQDKEQIKRVLKEVYGYNDIENFVKKELDEESVDRFLKTVFTYHDQVPQEGSLATKQ